MIHVLATIELQPGARPEFLTEFLRLVPLVHAEAGCVEYGPAVEVATTIAGVPAPRDNIVMVIEKWDSLAHLEAHLQAVHMNDYRARVKHLVVGTRLQVLEGVE